MAEEAEAEEAESEAEVARRQAEVARIQAENGYDMLELYEEEYNEILINSKKMLKNHI